MYQVLTVAKLSQRFGGQFSKILGNILPLGREYPTTATLKNCIATLLVPGRVFPLLTFHAQYLPLKLKKGI